MNRRPLERAEHHGPSLGYLWNLYQELRERNKREIPRSDAMVAKILTDELVSLENKIKSHPDYDPDIEVRIREFDDKN